MTWKRTATGNWLLARNGHRYVIESCAGYKDNKPKRVYRLRIDGIGGAEKFRSAGVYPSLPAAKSAAEMD
jgi:hypothetical protein